LYFFSVKESPGRFSTPHLGYQGCYNGVR